MADSTIAGLTTTDNVQDDDLFVIWKDGISQTRAVKKKDLGISGAGGNGNPYRCILYGYGASNKKSILVKKGTSFTFTYNNIDYVKTWDRDTRINLSSQISLASSVAETRTNQDNGRIFNMFLNTNGDIVLSTRLDAPSDIDNTYTADNTKWIGYFSTLCVSVPADQTSTLAVARNSYAVGNTVTVKGGYRKNDSYGIHTFYTKTISALTSTTYYDVATVPHTLAGFSAGDILPESVFCLGFLPHAINTGFEGAMGMVYDVDTDKAIDIYLQSGTGNNTATVFGATHTVSRQQQNHEDDMRCVCKQLLSDEEFTSSALGGNELTNINGSADQTSVGGHIDSLSKRMISFIGCEEMCGYVWQWLRNVSANGGSGISNYYGDNNFGQTIGSSYALLAGGAWDSASSRGSRCRLGLDARSFVSIYVCGRGSSKIMLY
jgi:hypothetical protein